MPPDQDEFSHLRCNGCGRSREFLPKVTLKRAAGGGITAAPAGYVCRQCNADVDAGQMAQSLELARRRKELADQERELDAEDPKKDKAPLVAGGKP